jgi:phytoene/squalene synthetase
LQVTNILRDVDKDLAQRARLFAASGDMASSSIQSTI